MFYPLAHLGFELPNKVNHEGLVFGLWTQKGLFVAFFSKKNCLILGKDGVARSVNQEFKAQTVGKKIQKALLARLLGIIDTVQFSIAGPIFLALHTFLFTGNAVGTIVTLPALCFKSKKHIWEKYFAKMICNFNSIFATSAALAATPAEIIAPEFVIKVLKMHKWGLSLPESEGY